MTTGFVESRGAMILSPGETFGAYIILGPLGRGGMGEVYRAKDSRLGREVALKILPGEAADDPERIRRFEQEARAASALNHPNIVVIYETGEALPAGRAQPVRFIAMELIDGDPLNVLLMGSRLSFKRTLNYAGQIADGLARAHESGIVHRDLKPSNMVVTRDGHLKILDFGLAKLRPLSAEDKTLEVTTDPTLTSPGTLLGTVGYMAPEQVRGEPTTPASDQFALGCIFFEMLTGERPFQRNSPAETLSAIMRDEPPSIEERDPNVPVPVRWIIERCLAKSPRDRYASTRDLARDLQKLREATTETSQRSISVKLNLPKRRRLRAAGAALFIAAVASAGGFLLFEKLRKVPLPTFQRLTFRHGVVWRALFAPNASSILFTADWEGQPTKTYLTLPESFGLDRTLEAEPLLPMAFSPDGSEVLVLLGTFRLPNGLLSGTLARMPALGGKPRPILEEAGWADWSRSGKFLAAVRNTGSERVLELRDSEGGNVKELFRTRGSISSVRFSPDDAWIAFVHHPDVQATNGQVHVVACDGASRRVLTALLESCFGLDWNDRAGEIWFTTTENRQGLLRAVTPSGRQRLVYAFPDHMVLQGIRAGSDLCLLTSANVRGALTVRQEGRPPRDLSWLDYTRVADISPDHKAILFYDEGPTTKTWGSWIRSIEGGDAVRLGAWEPGRFSPDGRRIIGTSSDATGNGQLVLFPVGAGDSRPLPTPGLAAAEPSFAGPDTILFVGTREGKQQVWTIQTDGRGLRPLGASDCTLPQPNSSLQSFVCEGGPGFGTIFVYPMDGGPGRKLFEHPAGKRFWYARFNALGDRIFAVASDRKFFTLDSTTGKVLSQETLPVPESLGYAELIDASLDAEGSIAAYSLNAYSAQLYSVSGLR